MTSATEVTDMQAKDPRQQWLRRTAAVAAVTGAALIAFASPVAAAEGEPSVTEASSFEPGQSESDQPAADLAPAGPTIDAMVVVTEASSFSPVGATPQGEPDPLGPSIAGPATTPTRLAYTGGAEMVMTGVGVTLIGIGTATCRFGAKRGVAS